VAAPEAADGVAILAVPRGPARRERADLIAADPGVPRLGDHLDAREDRVLADRLEERRVLRVALVLARERRREVEAETVDVHLLGPVAERVGDHLQHARVTQVEA